MSQAHGSAVRTLAAGVSELLVSGDADGFVNFFQVPDIPHLRPAASVARKEALGEAQKNVADMVADIFASASAPGAAVTVTRAADVDHAAVEGAHQSSLEPATALDTPLVASASHFLNSLSVDPKSAASSSDSVAAEEFNAELSPKPEHSEGLPLSLSSSPAAHSHSQPEISSSGSRSSLEEEDILGLYSNGWSSIEAIRLGEGTPASPRGTEAGASPPSAQLSDQRTSAEWAQTAGWIQHSAAAVAAMAGETPLVQPAYGTPTGASLPSEVSSHPLFDVEEGTDEGISGQEEGMAGRGGPGK